MSPSGGQARQRQPHKPLLFVAGWRRRGVPRVLSCEVSRTSPPASAQLRLQPPQAGTESRSQKIGGMSSRLQVRDLGDESSGCRRDRPSCVCPRTPRRPPMTAFPCVSRQRERRRSDGDARCCSLCPPKAANLAPSRTDRQTGVRSSGGGCSQNSESKYVCGAADSFIWISS